ncbi:sugar transferase [Ignavibacterium sp.]|uniref:sugar transferase n=1 Tax=Ignavibacterium sp. TaxID=2651167 RepID=UPI00220CC033|nr:sugar transferase [Ignavibacterium sp.]BDQ02754.1 MAG: UDP-phosphate galactose phosphotransferase [Ignavibacterium sp.]
MQKLLNYKNVYSIVDTVILTFSFFISVYLLRNDSSKSIIEFYASHPFVIPLIFLVVSFIILVFQYNGLYMIDVILKRTNHFAALLKAVYFSALTIVLFSMALDFYGLTDSRLLIFIFLLISIPLFISIRVFLLRQFYIELSKAGLRKNVLIVGDGEAGKLLATKLIYENPIGLNVVGFVNDQKKIGEFIINDLRNFGRLSDLPYLIKELKIDELIVAMDEDEDYDKVFSTIDYCKTLDVKVSITSEIFDVITERIKTEKYIDIPVISVDPKYNDSFTLTLKRFFDIAFAIIGLILLSPVMITIAILVKLSSPGPVFYKQKRIGLYGREFDFYKFRSMKPVDGEDEERKKKMIEFMKKGQTGGKDLKVVNEDRITWIGRFIRKTSLDELPQLFNVIKGDMSLVGPRPCLPYEFENYTEWQKRRVNVMPGCTGVWQVWGRSQVSFDDSVVMDIYYINNMSPWLDLQLIFQTIPVMLFSRGAR